MRIADITAGVVGTGFIGMAHVEALRRLGVRVAGVVGSSPERARAKADETGLHVYDDMDALLSDDAVDAVHIASPNDVHAEQANAVIAAGRHVICEKPLGLDSSQTTDLTGRAEAAGVVHAVCLNVRFYPLVHEMRALVANGDIGAPRLVSGSYLQDWLLLNTDWNWRLEPDRAGALRAVADIGSHWLDLATFVTGLRVEAVMADLHTFVPVRQRPAREVETFAIGGGDVERVPEQMTSDDAGGILLRFEGGARGIVTVSQVSAGRKNAISIEVDGADSALAWDSEDPERLWIGHRGRPNEVLRRDPGLVGEHARSLIGYPGGHVEGYPDTFKALFAKVYADIAEGGPATPASYPTFTDGHDAVCVTEAVARSAADGTWTTVQRDTRKD